MRGINYVFKGVGAFFILCIVALFAYPLTILAMLFINWDREFASLKTMHTTLKEEWFIQTFGDDDEKTIDDSH